MAVYSTARGVKFSHHALNSFSLGTISGWYAFRNPRSHIQLVLNPQFSSAARIPFVRSSRSTPNRL